MEEKVYIHQPKTLEKFVEILKNNKGAIAYPTRAVIFDHENRRIKLVMDSTSEIKSNQYSLHSCITAAQQNITTAFNYETRRYDNDEKFNYAVCNYELDAVDETGEKLNRIVKYLDCDSYYLHGDKLIRVLYNTGQIIVENDFVNKEKLDEVPESARKIKKDKFFTMLNEAWKNTAIGTHIRYGGIIYQVVAHDYLETIPERSIAGVTVAASGRIDPYIVAHHGRVFKKSCHDYGYNYIPYGKIELRSMASNRKIKFTSEKNAFPVIVIGQYDEQDS